MAIHIFALRSFTPKGSKKLITFDKKLNLHTTSVKKLFSKLDVLPEKIKLKENNPQGDYNIYYSACHIEDKPYIKNGEERINKRGFVSQSIIPFDIDHINPIYQVETLEIARDIIGISLEEMIAIDSGNGLQIIVKSPRQINSDTFFKDYKQHYKEICTKIKTSIVESGYALTNEEGEILTECDTSVFSAGRLLRLPNTFNRKPVTTPFAPDAIVKRARMLHHGDIEKGKGLQLIKYGELERVVKKDAEYAAPDHAYINEQCLFIKACLSGSIPVHEPDAYAFLGVASFYNDSDNTAKQGMSKFIASGISPTMSNFCEDDIYNKIDQARNASSPRTCVDIHARWGKCKTCPHFGAVKTPLSLRSEENTLSVLADLTKSKKEITLIYNYIKKYGVYYNLETSSLYAPEPNIIKDSGHLFLYDNVKWNLIEEDTESKIKRELMAITHHEYTLSKIDTVYDHMGNYLPTAPSNSLYTVNPFCANFQNGTLHVDKDRELQFKPHNREDFLVNILPCEYTPNGTNKNSMFSEILDNIFRGDDNKNEKILSLQEMFGASLMPIYPKIYFLIGGGGAGKSTICKILYGLLSSENISMCDPTEWIGFGMETMVGKLVNMVTDCSTNGHIKTNVFKQIEDRHSIRIQRKGLKDLYGTLPAVHVLGFNELPKIYEKRVEVLGRRIQTIQFNNIFTQDKNNKYNKFLAEDCLLHDRQSIMNWAVAGLIRLIENRGHFTNVEESEKIVREWSDDNNEPLILVREFVSDMVDDNSLIEHEDSSIKRSDLYKMFDRWIGKKRGIRTPPRKKIILNTLFDMYSLRKSNGEMIFRGIGFCDSSLSRSEF